MRRSTPSNSGCACTWQVCFLSAWLKAEETEELNGLEKIRVCVRKRPRTPREVKRNEADVVKVQGRQTIVVEEMKVAVDLTKFIQQVSLTLIISMLLRELIAFVGFAYTERQFNYGYQNSVILCMQSFV